MTLLFIAVVWVTVSAAATLLLCAMGCAGRLEDEARGYADLPPLPQPRPALDDAPVLV